MFLIVSAVESKYSFLLLSFDNLIGKLNEWHRQHIAGAAMC